MKYPCVREAKWENKVLIDIAKCLTRIEYDELTTAERQIVTLLVKAKILVKNENKMEFVNS